MNGNMFANQKNLPFLPVPDLTHTIECYLDSVQCIVTPEQFEVTKRIAYEFLKKEGSFLQRKLIEKDDMIVNGLLPSTSLTHGEAYQKDKSIIHPEGEDSRFPNTHWLESWWETQAYMADNSSLAVFINVFQSHFHASPYLPDPLLRCTLLILAESYFKSELYDGRFPPDYAGRQVQCSAQYLRIYSTTRIPGKIVDELHTWRNSDHICVERRGYWYVIENMSTVCFESLRSQLEWIKKNADEATEPGSGINVLTSLERREWAAEREYLISIDGSCENAESLRLLETAVFHVVLSEAKPNSRDDLQYIGQCGLANTGMWFDKSHTLIVCDNGMAITNLEHSAADAVCPGKLFSYDLAMKSLIFSLAKLFIAFDEWIHAHAPYAGYLDNFKAGVTGYKFEVDKGIISDQRDVNSKVETLPKPILFKLDSHMYSSIKNATEKLATLVDDNIVTCLIFPDFGAGMYLS